MKKYVFLYNVDEGELETDVMTNKLDVANVDFVVLNYSISEHKIDYEGNSLWILEDEYLIAWTILNYEELLGIQFYDMELITEAREGIKWFNRHKDIDYLEM